LPQRFFHHPNIASLLFLIPDLHAPNIFVNNNNSTSVTAIIDWQGAAVRPLFETATPQFIDVDTNNLDYVKFLGDDLEQPALPSAWKLG
jgi:hypothetical protein